MPRVTHQAGFGLIDTLTALTLLAVSLLGVSGGVHYALRATHATLLQTQAVGLIADLAEDLHLATAAEQLPELLSDWQLRVRQTLPARDFDPPLLSHAQIGTDGPEALSWTNVEMGWNNLRGAHDGSLLLPVTSPGSGTLL